MSCDVAYLAGLSVALELFRLAETWWTSLQGDCIRRHSIPYSRPKVGMQTDNARPLDVLAFQDPPTPPARSLA